MSFFSNPLKLHKKIFKNGPGQKLLGGGGGSKKSTSTGTPAQVMSRAAGRDAAEGGRGRIGNGQMKGKLLIKPGMKTGGGLPPQTKPAPRTGGNLPPQGRTAIRTGGALPPRTGNTGIVPPSTKNNPSRIFAGTGLRRPKVR
jgi:hypothetical protein